ncbi:MAG: alpha/beta fold hydrolase, partial [Telmatospirillum sp.]|nr:alpha/beta fold hydrolase [Telmatospirillum sp.]
MNRIEVDGGTVSYQVDGHGPGLVMVHGTGGDSRSNWDLLVPAFVDDWTVVRPDYAGSGQTRDAGGALDVGALAAQVVSAARASGAVPFDLVGFSLGAAVATVIAADYPDLVRRVVLLGAFLSSAAPRQRLQFGLWRDLIRTDRQAMARLILLTGFSPAHLAGMEAADIDAAAASIVADTRWDGMARQVELDLTLDVAGAGGRVPG